MYTMCKRDTKNNKKLANDVVKIAFSGQIHRKDNRKERRCTLCTIALINVLCFVLHRSIFIDRPFFTLSTLRPLRSFVSSQIALSTDAEKRIIAI